MCSSTPERASNFDGIRLTAALAVLWSHQFLLTGRAEPLLPHMRSPGHLAVLVFFSLSGYLVSASWASDPSPRRFLLRRLLRIWPAYAVNVVVLGAGAAYLARDELEAMAAQHWFWNLTFEGCDWGFVRGTVRHELNGSLWTIPYEVECYVLLAIAAALARRRLPWALAVVLAALLAAFAAWGGQAAVDVALRDWGTFPHLEYFGAFFLAGALLFHWPPTSTRLAAAIAAAAGVFAAGQYELASLLLIPVASIWIGRQAWPLLRSAGRFGDLSFGIYLWAWPVQQLGALWLGRTAPLGELLAVSLVYTAAAAWISWHAIEAPALRLKPRGAGALERPAAT